MKTKPAHLVLADGTLFSGTSFGYEGGSNGEVVFNTSLTGYQEILTDPSYCGQIVVMTYPEIGNYGVNLVDIEAAKPCLSGFVVKEHSPIVSNYRAKDSLGNYLKKNKIPGIEGVDTRALVRHVRQQGAMQALIVVGDLKNPAMLKKKAKALASMEGQDLVLKVTCKKPYVWKKGSPQIINHTTRLEGPKIVTKKKVKNPLKVVAYDYGIKQNILRLLVDYGCEVKVVPAAYPAEKVLAEKPDGIFLSNGPGDPAACTYAVENIRKLMGKKPMFGICLGHQLIGLALGAKTYKLKFGHHGGNQPVMDALTNKVEISSQNHGFAVDTDTLPRDVEATHRNLNDHTNEGIRHKKWPLFSVQHHPEAGPGPHDSHYLFQRFVEMMRK